MAITRAAITTGVAGGTASYRGAVDYSGDRYGVTAEHLLIGERFDAQTGYVRRTDFRRTFGEARFTPVLDVERWCGSSLTWGALTT